MVDNNKTLILISFLLALFVAPSAWAATIDVQVDRNVIEDGESINLQFSSKQGIDDDPDFTPLEKDFMVNNPTRSYSMSFVNGNLSRSTSWAVTLVPRRTGIFQIPAIHFGKDISRSIRIQVNPASTSKDDGTDQLFILEVDVDKQNAYVQSQIILSVKIFHAVGLVSASLSEIQLDDSDAIVEKLGDDLSYEKQIDDRLYKVFEKRYAIYPQKSGKLSIAPIIFEGQFASTRQPARRTWPGISLSRATQIKRLRSKKITVDVKSVPKNYKGDWVPAKDVLLAEDWPAGDPKFVVGEPVTRMITLIADGILSTQIPEIHKAKVENIKQYTDQPFMDNKNSINGIVGMRQESIALIPTAPGKYTLPAIEVPWWNVDKGRREVARIKKRVIEVAEAPNTPNKILSNIPLSKQLSGEKITRQNAESTNMLNVPTHQYNRYLLLISASLLTGWLLTIMAWWYTSKKRSNNIQPELVKAEISSKQIKRKLTAACYANNKYLCKELLLQWGKNSFPAQIPNSLGQLSMCCDEPLKSQLVLLNAALYAVKSSEVWNGKLLLDAFLKSNKIKKENTGGALQVIKPLRYKVANE